MKFKYKSILFLFVLFFFLSAPISSCVATPEYSLGIRENASFLWKVTFVHEDIDNLLNHQTQGLHYPLNTEAKLIVYEINEWHRVWEIECRCYWNPFWDYYESYYNVYKYHSIDDREFYFNPREEYSHIFVAKPTEYYLSNYSARKPNLISNGSTIISYNGNESSYLYRAEGEYSKSGVLLSAKYYLETDELIFQWELIPPSKSVSGYLLIPSILLMVLSMIGLISLILKKKSNLMIK